MIRRLVALVIVVAVVCGLVVLRPVKVEAECGPSVGTPRVVRALDASEGIGATVSRLTDGVSTWDVFTTVTRTIGMMNSLWNNMKSVASTGKPTKEADRWRKVGEESQRQALLGCCAQQVDRQNPPPGSPPPPDEEQPWDPQLASIGQLPLDCAPVICQASSGQPVSASVRQDDPGVQGGGYSPEQRSITKAMLRELRKSGIPERLQERAAVTALAAGFQESGVRNLPYGHSSSVGWLQLIDAHGTVEQRLDPAFSARWFFRELQGPAVKRRMGKPWTKLSVNDAAQGTQGSGYPDAYAQHEGRARRLLAAVGGVGTDVGAVPDGDCIPDPQGAQALGEAAPAKWRFGGQRTPDQAVAWLRRMAETKAGDPTRGTSWAGLCLAAVGQAYGHTSTAAVNGHHYAVDVFTQMPSRYKVKGSTPPPKGALVFWDTGRVEGHIAVSNGDGKVWTTDADGAKGRISLAPIGEIDGWGPRLGYTAPVFTGRTETGVQV